MFLHLVTLLWSLYASEGKKRFKIRNSAANLNQTRLVNVIRKQIFPNTIGMTQIMSAGCNAQLTSHSAIFWTKRCYT